MDYPPVFSEDTTNEVNSEEKPIYLSSKVIKVETSKGEPEKQKSRKSKKDVREKLRNTLDRLSKKAEAKDDQVKEDLTKSQKEIQNLESLLDSAQVGLMSCFNSLMYLHVSDPGEAFRSKLTCDDEESKTLPPAPVLSSTPSTSVIQLSSIPNSCFMNYSDGKQEFDLTLLLMLFVPTVAPFLSQWMFRFIVYFYFFQAVKCDLLNKYLLHSNFNFIYLKSVRKINVFQDRHCEYIPANNSIYPCNLISITVI